MNGKYLVLERLKRLNQIKLRLAHLESHLKGPYFCSISFFVIFNIIWGFLHQNSQNLDFFFFPSSLWLIKLIMLFLLLLTNDRSYDWLTSVSQQSSNVSQESQVYK